MKDTYLPKVNTFYQPPQDDLLYWAVIFMIFVATIFILSHGRGI